MIRTCWSLSSSSLRLLLVEGAVAFDGLFVGLKHAISSVDGCSIQFVQRLFGDECIWAMSVYPSLLDGARMSVHVEACDETLGQRFVSCAGCSRLLCNPKWAAGCWRGAAVAVVS